MQFPKMLMWERPLLNRSKSNRTPCSTCSTCMRNEIHPTAPHVHVSMKMMHRFETGILANTFGDRYGIMQRFAVIALKVSCAAATQI